MKAFKHDSQNGLLGKRGNKIAFVPAGFWDSVGRTCAKLGSRVNPDLTEEEFEAIIKGTKQ